MGKIVNQKEVDQILKKKIGGGVSSDTLVNKTYKWVQKGTRIRRIIYWDLLFNIP